MADDQTKIRVPEPSVKQLLDWADAGRNALSDEYGMHDLEAWLRQCAMDRAHSRPAPIDDGVEIIGDQRYMRDAQNRLVPVEVVRPLNLLIDQTVRKIMGYALPLAAEVSRFRQHSFDDVDTLLGLCAAEYKTNLGGHKGNITLTSLNGLMQIKVQVAEHIAFGPELQVAKALVDECLTEWTEGANVNLLAIVDRAFQVNKEGQINRAQLLGLRQYDVKDDRWARAMDAIADSMRVVGSKRYVRIYRRPNTNAAWEGVVIDVAAS